MTKRYLSFFCALFLLAACGDNEDDNAAPKPQAPAEELYAEARALMDQREYKQAIPAFEEVERQHPDSPWAVHGQVMAGYAHYKVGQFDEAIGTLQRFVRLYPANDSTPYAYYLIALSYYAQISDVGRDQKVTELALQSLREVMRRFPESEYARDARIKADLTIDHLAGKEMQVGRYYLERDDYLAAINRFRFVVENYETTSHSAEALHRLVECYLKLGVTEEAQRYAAVLGHNYPDSRWYKDSYKIMTDEGQAMPTPVEDSWLDSITPW